MNRHNEKTTPRENLLRVLKGERPEWIPVTGHCDPYNQPSKAGMDPALAAKLARLKWGDESTVAFSRYLRIDIADWFSGATLIQTKHRKIKVSTHKDSQGRTISTWQTPKGDLQRIAQYSADTKLTYTVEHEIKDKDDLARLACVFEDADYSITPGERRQYNTRRQMIGEDGIILCPMSGTPLGQMVRVHAGVETTAYLWSDARRELHDLFKVIEDAHRRLLALKLSVENDVIVTVDDTSTTTISPDMFAEFCLGYTDRMVDVVHAAGRFYFHHSCGLIRDLLPLYRQTKMDAVHAFMPPPIGNVTVAEGRRLLGPNITIMAGFGSIQMTVNSGSRTEAARGIETLFRDAAPGNRFIINLSAEPCNTMEELEFIVQECRKYQRMYSSNGT